MINGAFSRLFLRNLGVIDIAVEVIINLCPFGIDVDVLLIIGLIEIKAFFIVLVSVPTFKDVTIPFRFTRISWFLSRLKDLHFILGSIRSSDESYVRVIRCRFRARCLFRYHWGVAVITRGAP